MPNIDFNNPTVRALVSEGKSRGYPPLAIAASIGNAHQESSFNTDARGDKGTAYGAFQWRKDRFANLQRNASELGLDWRDPQAQAKHWYNEQDGVYGSEGRYGEKLKSASTPEEATDAVISALRPKGWTKQNPSGGHGYSNRLGATKEALRQMNGGAGGESEEGTLNAYKPMNASGTNPNGTTAPVPGAPEVPEVPEAPKSTFDQVMSGGPGALWGKPQEGWNAGDALLGASAALMARDNPTGAAAMAATLKAGRDDSKNTDKKVHFDNKTGMAYSHGADGRVTAQKVGPGEVKEDSLLAIDKTTGSGTFRRQDGSFYTKPLQSPENKLSPEGTSKRYQENDKLAETNFQASEKSGDFARLIMEDKLDLSALGRIGNNWSQYTNSSNEKERNAANLIAHIENMKNARLLEAKGVQTEGDAVRAMNALFPGAGQFDNKFMAQRLKELSGEFKDTGEQYTRFNSGLRSKFKDLDTGNDQERHDTRVGNIKKLHEDLNDKWTSYSQQAPAPTTPNVTGGDRNARAAPASPAAPARKSFYETYRNK